MLKNRVDYKLINFALIALIVYLVYQTRDFWIGIFGLVSKIIFPFLVAFALAYAFYPFVRKLVSKNVPKPLALVTVILFIVGVLVLFVSLVTPTIITQMTSLFNGIISFIRELSSTYNIDLKDLQDTLSLSFNDILKNAGSYISNGALSVISISIDYASKIFIIFAAFVYFLADMDKIRSFIKDYFRRKPRKIYNYVVMLDREMGSYLSGFMKIILISFFEYTIAYLIIGHPNALMLGFLAGIGNLIPYFGGIITNIIAGITAFVISPDLFIKTCILFVAFSMIDGYVINPLVYGKTNKVHPLVVVVSVFAGGILGGVLGIVISLPTAILIIATLKYFKKDILRIKKKGID